MPASRREFLREIGVPAAALAAGASLMRTRAVRAADLLKSHSSNALAPAEAARDEDYWGMVGEAFSVDRSILNLNNGGVSPSPTGVQDSMQRHLRYSNTAPGYTMWRILEPQREAVRAQLARTFGCDTEEVAVTRNASESLQICQFGFDLKRGDEVLTTTQDYPRMLTTFRQRARREGIILRQFSIPMPCHDARDIVAGYEKNITPQTRLILVSHVYFCSGHVGPVREVAALGRKHGIPVVVDGAHALAHLDFQIRDLDCDYYASSLHKWLCAPHGTGLLYVRRDKIAGLWPLMAAEAKQDNDIRKFEEIGTHPAANILAIGDAITFHRAIGPARKLARLVYLRDRWADRLSNESRVRIHTSRKPGRSGVLCVFEVEGLDPTKLTNWLWDHHRIFVVAIEHEDFKGIRVSPSVYTTPDEIDRFSEAVEQAIKNGIPA